MYAPPYNRVDDRALVLEFMRANSFVVLVTAPGGELGASHLPCLVETRGESIVLRMHMARTNPQWQGFFDDEVLVIFSGPHAYVSPRWYARAPAVPTWNYAAVHAYGPVRVIDDPRAKHAAMADLVSHYDPQWRGQFDALPEQYRTDMFANIVAFEIAVTRLDTRWKLSQNRGRDEQERVAVQLERSADSTEQALAALTRAHFVDA